MNEWTITVHKYSSNIDLPDNIPVVSKFPIPKFPFNDFSPTFQKKKKSMFLTHSKYYKGASPQGGKSY